MEKSIYDAKANKLTLVFYGVIILALILIAASGIIIYRSFDSGTDRGTFGDMFGLVNSLFSGLAFAGVIYTILLQRIDLEMQRDEISKSTTELKGQRLALDRQNFENKFFQMINIHHLIVNEIHENWQHQNPPRYNDKREIFGNAAILINKKFNHPQLYQGLLDIPKLIKVYQEEVYEKHRAVFGHYFRNLFHIVKYVDETMELDYLEKEDNPMVRYNYIKILRAQLSSYEILLLAYNGLTPYGENFRNNINKYKLLKNIDFDGYVVATEALFEYYPHLENAHTEYLKHHK